MSPASRRGFVPSGEQVQLRHGDQEAVVVEVGGGLRSYSKRGREILDGYAEHERCPSAAGQLLLPWPNRLQDGSYEWEGQRHQVPLSEPARRNAIHGLLRWVSWTVRERSQARVELGHALHPQDGYPFALELLVSYELDPEGLTVRTTATNVGLTACPYGAGAHPYLTLGGGGVVDDWILQAPGTVSLQTDDRAIPTGSQPVDGTEMDFTTPRRIGSTKLDTAYAQLQRGADGKAAVSIEAPEEEASVTLWMDEHHPYLMLFTGDTLQQQERRRRAVAVEPMTCAPNAFRSGDGLRTLRPGESFASCWGIRAS